MKRGTYFFVGTGGYTGGLSGQLCPTCLALSSEYGLLLIALVGEPSPSYSMPRSGITMVASLGGVLFKSRTHLSGKLYLARGSVCYAVTFTRSIFLAVLRPRATF